MVENQAPPKRTATFVPFKAPDFTLEKLNGGTFTLSSYQGRFIILNFFGVGCSPCLLESPHLVALQQKYKDDGLSVVSINAWDDWRISVKKYAKKGGLGENAVVLLKGKSVAKQYDVTGVPRTFWIDREGVVIDTSSGFDEKDSTELESRTRKALGLNPS